MLLWFILLRELPLVRKNLCEGYLKEEEFKLKCPIKNIVPLSKWHYSQELYDGLFFVASIHRAEIRGSRTDSRYFLVFCGVTIDDILFVKVDNLQFRRAA